MCQVHSTPDFGEIPHAMISITLQIVPLVVGATRNAKGLKGSSFSGSTGLGVIFAPTWASVMVTEGINQTMPSLFRFLFVLTTIAGVVFGGLYVIATKYEPEQQLISKPVPSVKIRR